MDETERLPTQTTETLSNTSKGPKCQLLLPALIVALFLLILYSYASDLYTSSNIPDLSHLPPKCLALATTFWQIQTTSTKSHLVLTCHRKWCSTWGYCEPCAGVGDRTRHLLRLVDHAFQLQQPILLDYDNPSLDIPNSLVYQEGIWSELFHTRKYDVSSQKTDPRNWGTSLQFAHFFATHDWNTETYDPCWFHILFQKSTHLQSEFEKYTPKKSDSIGVHFRTGDGVAFGIPNKDIRVVGDMEVALHKMVTCAKKLANELCNSTLNSNTILFLATDNTEVKDIARRKYPGTIITTAMQPSSYLKSDDEFGVWLDFFLLLQSNGLVVNKNRKGYNGTAHSLSTMATMVMEVGTLDNEHVVECHL